MSFLFFLAFLDPWSEEKEMSSSSSWMGWGKSFFEVTLSLDFWLGGGAIGVGYFKLDAKDDKLSIG